MDMGLSQPWGVDLMLPTVQALRLGLTQPLHLEAMGMATEATTFHHITQNLCQILALSEDIHSHIQLRKWFPLIFNPSEPSPILDADLIQKILFWNSWSTLWNDASRIILMYIKRRISLFFDP